MKWRLHQIGTFDRLVPSRKIMTGNGRNSSRHCWLRKKWDWGKKFATWHSGNCVAPHNVRLLPTRFRNYLSIRNHSGYKFEIEHQFNQLLAELAKSLRGLLILKTTDSLIDSIKLHFIPAVAKVKINKWMGQLTWLQNLSRFPSRPIWVSLNFD